MSKLKTAPIADKTFLTAEKYKKLKGTIEAKQYVYDKEKKLYCKSIKLIRGIASAKRNVKQFGLVTTVGHIGKMYLSADGKLTNDRKQARLFYCGYDNPEVRRKFWEEVTGLKFITCNL